MSPKTTEICGPLPSLSLGSSGMYFTSADGMTMISLPAFSARAVLASPRAPVSSGTTTIHRIFFMFVSSKCLVEGQYDRGEVSGLGRPDARGCDKLALLLLHARGKSGQGVYPLGRVVRAGRNMMARRGVRLVVAVSLGSTLGSIGCFGPLDSPLLPPRRDTGVDLRMEVAVDRRPDIAIVDVTPPDAADAGRPDARDALDAGGVLDAFDARVAGDARDGADARNPIDASDAAPPSDASDARVIFDMRP